MRFSTLAPIACALALSGGTTPHVDPAHQDALAFVEDVVCAKQSGQALETLGAGGNETPTVRMVKIVPEVNRTLRYEGENYTLRRHVWALVPEPLWDDLRSKDEALQMTTAMNVHVGDEYEAPVGDPVPAPASSSDRVVRTRDGQYTRSDNPRLIEHPEGGFVLDARENEAANPDAPAAEADAPALC